MKYRLLESELAGYKKALGEAADTVIDQDVSEYPIFVVHQQQVDIGIPIIDREKVEGNWSVNVSTLEEFVTKQLIEEEKIEEFRKLYADPREDLCCFILSELGARFVFMPRK